MHRFHAPVAGGRTWGELVLLSPAESHHAVNVLRIREAETVGLLDGVGHFAEAKVEIVHKRGVQVRITSRDEQPSPATRLVLFQSVIKGKQMEWLVQKATELGASRIVPIQTDRSVVQLEGKRAESKADKWQAIATEAIKQCGSYWLPEVTEPVTVHDLLADHENLPVLNVVASLEDGRRLLRDILDEDVQQRGQMPESMGLWIGPEGDFTGGEYSGLRQAGAKSVTLGPLVLRAETAGLTALAQASYEVLLRTQ